MPLDLSGGEKPGQVQENLIAYIRLFAGLPNTTLVDDDDVFWFICGDRAPGNTIFRVRWPAEGVEQRIDALYEQIGQHLDEIDWFVFPGDQPPDLNARLEARGMPGKPGGNWLWCDLTTLSPAPVVPDGFRIAFVRDDVMMAEWVRISEAGFGEQLGIFYDVYARHGYGSDAFSLHYIGYLGDTPVTSGTLLEAGGCATIYDLSTPPEFRGQGFGGALTHFLMREIRSKGYADTWIWASNMAKSLYQKLGYVDVDFGMREHSWRKP